MVDYVKIELAQELKSIGFDAQCMACYNEDNKLVYLLGPFKNQENDKFIACPSYFQVIDWFFVKYGYFVKIDVDVYTTGVNYLFQIFWYNPKEEWTEDTLTTLDFYGGTGSYGDNHEYPNPIAVHIAAIKKMIELTKTKIHDKNDQKSS